MRANFIFAVVVGTISGSTPFNAVILALTEGCVQGTTSLITYYWRRACGERVSLRQEQRSRRHRIKQLRQQVPAMLQAASDSDFFVMFTPTTCCSSVPF